MRVTRQQATENRKHVLRLAARRFRERGLHGIGVAELMKEAGFTHGGFYKQFRSKNDLAAQACALAIAENLACYLPAQDISALAKEILSPTRRDNPGGSCLVAALGSDIARSPSTVRRETTAGIEKILSFLTTLFPGHPKKQARQQALAAYATIVGALVVARVVEDPKLSSEFLAAAQAGLGRAGFSEK